MKAFGSPSRFRRFPPCFVLRAFVGAGPFGFLFAQPSSLVRLGFRLAVQFGVRVFDFAQLQAHSFGGETLLQLPQRQIGLVRLVQLPA